MNPVRLAQSFLMDVAADLLPDDERRLRARQLAIELEPVAWPDGPRMEFTPVAALMAQTVSASAGPVESDEGPIQVIRLLFHYGWTPPLTAESEPVHDQRFVDPTCLRRLIFELTSLADQLGL